MRRTRYGRSQPTPNIAQWYALVVADFSFFVLRICARTTPVTVSVVLLQPEGHSYAHTGLWIVSSRMLQVIGFWINAIMGYTSCAYCILGSGKNEYVVTERHNWVAPWTGGFDGGETVYRVLLIRYMSDGVCIAIVRAYSLSLYLKIWRSCELQQLPQCTAPVAGSTCYFRL